MKANKLTLGDHVQVNGEACKVISISYFDIGISDSKEDFYHVHIDNIKPLPITAEILEKNFTAIPNTLWSSVDYFYYNSSHTVKICRYIVDGTWKITYGEDTIGGKSEWRMYATYVHELQHALRLCGIEKEIEL